MQATLADSFLADLEDLSDDEIHDEVCFWMPFAHPPLLAVVLRFVTSLAFLKSVCRILSEVSLFRGKYGFLQH